MNHSDWRLAVPAIKTIPKTATMPAHFVMKALRWTSMSGDKAKPSSDAAQTAASRGWSSSSGPSSPSAKTIRPNQNLPPRAMRASASNGQRETWQSSR